MNENGFQNYNNFKSYRPINILPIIPTIFEKNILEEIIKKNNYMGHQFWLLLETIMISPQEFGHRNLRLSII